ncbi:MAG: outer membrane lipoprotein chaperone LolA [Gammaproteobacteria bacterium]|nr:outer membrane lipoprotein chaperone LolA [Gammaproteobacteria bacterium]
MYKNILTIINLFCLPVGSLVAGPLDPYFGNLKTFAADFTQSQVQGTDRLQNNQGKIYIQSPNKFRMDYTTPYVQIYVADGEKVYQYDEDLEQVIIKQQAQILNNTPLFVLSNTKKLQKSYHIEAQGAWEGQKWFLLRPKSANTNFEQIRLGFKDKNLSTMELKDSFGQFSRLKFRNVKNNQPLQSSLFKFTPPEGVDVITE